MSIKICSWVCIYIYIPPRIDTAVPKYLYLQLYIYIYTYCYLYMLIPRYTCMHRYLKITVLCTFTCMYTYRYVHISIYLQRYIHTYVCIYKNHTIYLHIYWHILTYRRAGTVAGIPPHHHQRRHLHPPQQDPRPPSRSPLPPGCRCILPKGFIKTQIEEKQEGGGELLGSGNFLLKQCNQVVLQSDSIMENQP